MTKQTNSVRVEFLFGHGFTRNGRKLSASQVKDSMRRIMAKAAFLFGGFTLLDSVGAWRNAEGNLVTEPGKALVTMQPEADARLLAKVGEFQDYVCITLRQEAVAVAIFPVYFTDSLDWLWLTSDTPAKSAQPHHNP